MWCLFKKEVRSAFFLLVVAKFLLAMSVPTPEDVLTLTLASAAFRWAQLNEETTKIVMSALGLQDTDLIRVLAAFVEKDFEDALLDKSLAPAVKAKVAVAWGAAKFIV